MVQFQPWPLALLALSPLAMHLLCQRFDPRRLHGRLLGKCVLGFMLLLAWNMLAPLRLGVNPLSACLAGSLGLPGLGMLALIKLML